MSLNFISRALSCPLHDQVGRAVLYQHWNIPKVSATPHSVFFSSHRPAQANERQAGLQPYFHGTIEPWQICRIPAFIRPWGRSPRLNVAHLRGAPQLKQIVAGTGKHALPVPAKSGAMPDHDRRPQNSQRFWADCQACPALNGWRSLERRSRPASRDLQPQAVEQISACRKGCDPRRFGEQRGLPAVRAVRLQELCDGRIEITCAGGPSRHLRSPTGTWRPDNPRPGRPDCQ